MNSYITTTKDARKLEILQNKDSLINSIVMNDLANFFGFSITVNETKVFNRDKKGCITEEIGYFIKGNKKIKRIKLSRKPLNTYIWIYNDERQKLVTMSFLDQTMTELVTVYYYDNNQLYLEVNYTYQDKWLRTRKNAIFYHEGKKYKMEKYKGSLKEVIFYKKIVDIDETLELPLPNVHHRLLDQLVQPELEILASEDYSIKSAILGAVSLQTGEIMSVSEYIKFNTPRGHGFAAEQANHLIDRMKGKNSIHLGSDNKLNGADRIVDGVYIQSKEIRACHHPKNVEICRQVDFKESSVESKISAGFFSI